MLALVLTAGAHGSLVPRRWSKPELLSGVASRWLPRYVSLCSYPNSASQETAADEQLPQALLVPSW